MPDIQFIGLDRRSFEQEKGHVRRLLAKEDYADKLTLVWFDSASEGLADGKPAPFMRIQGRPEALDGFANALVAKLTQYYDIEIAHNARWIPRQS